MATNRLKNNNAGGVINLLPMNKWDTILYSLIIISLIKKCVYYKGRGLILVGPPEGALMALQSSESTTQFFTEVYLNCDNHYPLIKYVFL